MRRLKHFVAACLHMLLGGCFLAAATFFFRSEDYSIASGLMLAGIVCVALGIDLVKENFSE